MSIQRVPPVDRQCTCPTKPFEHLHVVFTAVLLRVAASDRCAHGRRVLAYHSRHHHIAAGVGEVGVVFLKTSAVARRPWAHHFQALSLIRRVLFCCIPARSGIRGRRSSGALFDDAFEALVDASNKRPSTVFLSSQGRNSVAALDELHRRANAERTFHCGYSRVGKPRRGATE